MSTRGTFHVVVVGAGPSGLIAAETLAVLGAQVTVLEPHRSPGRKFLLAGRSGLNLTHSEPLGQLLERYERGSCSALVRRAVAEFPPSALRAWSTDLGEAATVGSSGRVFPKSWRATPLLRAWLMRLAELGVSASTGSRLVGIDCRTGDGHSVVLQVARTGRVEGTGRVEQMTADAVVLAMGGMSWPTTGSDGGWRQMLLDEGVHIAAFRAANAGVVVDWSEVFRCRYEGVAIKHVSVSGGPTGDVVVTHSGLIGGPIYTISSQIDGPTCLPVDLRPDDSVEKLAGRLANSRAGDSLTSRLRKIGLSEVASGLVIECGGRDIVRSPQILAQFVKAVPVAVTGTEGVRRAISVSGGVEARSLDEQLMLRTLPGVFVAGEMLDWDAATGGYLLQACFSTGVAAANGAFDWLTRASPK